MENKITTGQLLDANKKILDLEREIKEKQRIIDSLMESSTIYPDGGLSFRLEWQRREQNHRAKVLGGSPRDHQLTEDERNEPGRCSLVSTQSKSSFAHASTPIQTYAKVVGCE